jgi:hypothetical protein
MIDKKFITAGKAIFTVEVPESLGKKPHYTYRVQLRPANDRFPDTYFVGILTGPDNNKDYSYLGILDTKTGVVKTTQKSKFGSTDFVVRLLNRTLNRIWNNETHYIEEAGFNLHHEGKCGRCGRRLTVPESIETGLGPECYGKVV